MIILLSYIFYFVAASASPLQRRWLATKENISHEGQLHFAFQVAAIIAILGLSLPFIRPFSLNINPFYLVTLAFLCGSAGIGYYASLYNAQRHVEAGVTNLVLNIYTPITIMLATLFLNEKLNFVQIIGTVLLLIGMVVVSKQHRIGKFQFDKNFILMILSGIMLGIVLTAERALQKITGFTAGTMISWWSQFIFLGLAVFVTKSKSKYTKKDVTITGVLRFFQALSWVLLLLVVGNLSIVSAVTTFKVVIIFIAAAIFLKEREDLLRKTIGSIIALAGLFLMR